MNLPTNSLLREATHPGIPNTEIPVSDAAPHVVSDVATRVEGTEVLRSDRAAKRERDLLWIRRLIWTYFWLLIFEGALRKWVLPFAAGPLLLVRDPVVLAIYGLAWRSGLFPRNSFVLACGVLGFLSFVTGLVALEGNYAVALYGFRASFLHLPLIFLISRVFTLADVRRVGYFCLLIAIPMALLMAAQFSSSPSSFINAGADEQFKQIDSELGRIRAPGTFSFISGPMLFFPLVTAFLLHSSFVRRYSWWLTLGGAFSLMLAAAVSGSRALVLSVAFVFILALACSLILRPQLAMRWIWLSLVAFIVVFLLSDLPIFQESLGVFSARLERASGSEGGIDGFAARILSDYAGVWPQLQGAPLIGHGLGLGTNGGAALLTGEVRFLLAEGEWARVVLESGPLLGGAFVFYRVILMLWIGQIALRHTARRDPLPLLLFGACALNIINGNLGQPTTLGFAVFVAGLCLAATREVRRVPAASVLHSPTSGAAESTRSASVPSAAPVSS